MIEMAPKLQERSNNNIKNSNNNKTFISLPKDEV